MSYWLRVRRLRACVCTILLVVLSSFLFNELYLPLPNLLRGSALAIPVAFLVPVSLAVVLSWSLTRGDPFIEAVTSRPLAWYDLGYALSIALITLMGCVLVKFVTGSDLALAAGRNGLGYIGLTLIGRRLINVQAGAVLPTAYVLLASLFGTNIARQPYWWAWALAASDTIWSWLISVSLLVVGSVVALSEDNRPIADR